MSYREENGQVVLTMSKADYDRLLMTFAMATMKAGKLRVKFPAAKLNIIALLNRLNEGNPNYTPYEVAEKS